MKIMNRLLHKCLLKQSFIQIIQQRSLCHHCRPDSKPIVTSKQKTQNFIDDFYFGNLEELNCPEDLKLNETQSADQEEPLALNLLGDDHDHVEVSLIDKHYFSGEGGATLKQRPEIEKKSSPLTEDDEDLNFFDQQMFPSSRSTVPERFAPQLRGENEEL